MGLDNDYVDGQAPIDKDERSGLLIETISTKAELDEFEQQNIEEAMQWVLARKFNAQEVFTEKFICNLHKRMYSNVWTWAGEFRKTDKNLGIDKFQIPMMLRSLCDDALFWVEHETFERDEIAIRFKHRIVSIHCFSNGDGRHSRLMGDIINEKLFNSSPFSWGAAKKSPNRNVRTEYLQALKSADKGVYGPLVEFARS